MNAKTGLYSAAVASLLLLAGGLFQDKAKGQRGSNGEEPPLPSDVVVDVDAIESQVVRIGVSHFGGSDPHQGEASAIIANDFTLFPGYQVVSETGSSPSRSLTPRIGAWSGQDIRGVITGHVTSSGTVRGVAQLRAEFRYYRVASPGQPLHTGSFQGAAGDLRDWAHQFGNNVLEELTGKAGPFGTQITFAKRVGPGRKDVHCSDMDGQDLMRVTNGRGISMLPGFDDAGRIWFTRLSNTGMFITRIGTRGRRILESSGTTMAPSICEGRVYFASSRDGNSEIYSANLEGGDIQRLTNHPAIDVSPTCGPNNKLAWVSARHGSPQIWMMNRDGSGAERLTFKGNHNQTPAFCRDGSVPLVAFTGRDSALDIFTVNTQTKDIVRLTQGQGNNKDPAFSPDCRMVAFVSDRRGAPGIYVSSVLGFNQHRVVEGAAETIRWMHR